LWDSDQGSKQTKEVGSATRKGKKNEQYARGGREWGPFGGTVTGNGGSKKNNVESGLFGEKRNTMRTQVRLEGDFTKNTKESGRFWSERQN